MLYVTSISELLHVLLFSLRFLLRVLLGMMMNQFFELFYADFVEFELFFFFLENKEFFFLLNSFLHKFSLNGLNFFVPAPLGLFPLFF